MTVATTLPYHKEVIQVGPNDYDALLNKQYIGSFPTSGQAWTELDKVAYADATHSGAAAYRHEGQVDHLPAANALIPFGVDAGPDPELCRIHVADVARAAEAIIDAYEDKQAIVTRALSAYDLAVTALLEQTKQPDTRTVLVRENGDLKIVGSKIYWISGQGCTCPDYRHLVYGNKYAGSGADSGMCKHTLTREILRLAQARQGVINPEQGNKTATATLNAAQLLRALKALIKGAQTTNPITLAITYTRIRLTLDGVVKELKGLDLGWGIRSLSLSQADATKLIASLSSIAKEASINLMLDAGEMEVSVFGEGFGASYPAII